MPPKLTPEAITGTLDELVVFAETNAATLATRSGTDMLSSLRKHHSKEEQRFFMFLYKKKDRFTEAHRRQVADAYAHVVQARAAAAAPAVPVAPSAASAARARPQDLRAAAAATPLPAVPASAAAVAAQAAARKRPHTFPEPNASSRAAAASATASLAQWRRLKAESDAPAARPLDPDAGLADPLSTAASSKPTMPKRAKTAAAEPEEPPEEPEAEGAARKRPRRDADGAATSTNVTADDDDLLCDWIGAVAWLETDAAYAATPT